MTHPDSGMTRRDLLAAGAAGAMTLALGRLAPAAELFNADKPKSTVVLVRRKDAVAKDGTANPKAVAEMVDMVESGQPAVVNTYPRSVRPEGNRTAVDVMHRVFEVREAEWRGLGRVPASGLALRPAYARFDAALAFPVEPGPVREHSGCRCGDVLRGVVEPLDCPLFRRVCTPARPIGPCMVSAEGACAAWYKYGDVDV